MLGKANSRHAQLGNALYQRFNPDQAIHHGVFGMDAEVYKSLRHNVRLFLLCNSVGAAGSTADHGPEFFFGLGSKTGLDQIAARINQKSGRQRDR